MCRAPACGDYFSTSLHVASEIHAFLLASCAFGSRIYLCRDAKRQSYIIGVVGGQRGSRVRRLRYLVCSLKGSLQSHPRTM